MLKFITGKPLWVNILFSVVLIAVLIVLFLVSLNLITRHGSKVNIPSVTGKSYADARKQLESQGFEVMIQDSVYNDTAAPTAVLRQFPEADEVVKSNRTVYLTINRVVPPTIDAPLLEGLTFRNAELVLKQYGLKLGDVTYKADFAKNNVLEAYFNENRLKPGTKIRMGSKIDLVLANGVGSEEFAVPDLFGKTYYEAKIYLESLGLIVSPVPEGDIVDTNTAYVSRQNPEPYTPDGRQNRIRQGEMVDVFINAQKPVRPVKTDSIPQ